MLESLETILATEEKLNNELEERALTLEKSLGEKDATIQALEEARDKATTDRNNYSRQLMALRASDNMYKRYMVKLEGDRDQYKTEAIQLRSDLETAKQTYARETQDLKHEHEQAVTSATKAHEDSKTSHKNQVGQMQQRIEEDKTKHEEKTREMQQRINETTTARESEKEAMQKRIDEAANTHNTEKEAMQRRIDESRKEFERLQQSINETAVKHKTTTDGLQKRIDDDAAATHKKKAEKMQQQIEDDRTNHEKKMDEMQQQMITSKATHDTQLKNMQLLHEETVNEMQQSMQASHDAEKEVLQQNFEEVKTKRRKKVTKLKTQIQDSEATHKNKVEEMQTRIDACNTARSEDAEAHDKEMDRIRKEMEAMRNTHWAAIETEKSMYGQEKQTLETSHHQEKGCYETALEKSKFEVETLRTTIQSAREERQKLEEKNAGLEYLQMLVHTKTAVEGQLEEERRSTALQDSHVEGLQADLKDVESEKVQIGNQLASTEADVQVLQESLGTETRKTAEAERSLQLANESHANALFQWRRLFLGPNAIRSEHTLALAISKGTQVAAQDHGPWLISEASTADQRYSEFPHHALGAVVSMLIKVLQDKDFEVQWFQGLIRRLIKLISQAPRVNTALIQWIVDHSNWTLSLVDPHEHVIPARAAIWALVDVLRRRWPSTGPIEHPHEIMQECVDLIAQHDPQVLDAQGLNAQRKVPVVLELEQDNNGSVIHLVKKPEWAWAVIMDMQKQTCAFVKEQCMRDVAMGNGIRDKEVKAGNAVVHLDMGKRKCVNFYIEHWSFEQ